MDHDFDDEPSEEERSDQVRRALITGLVAVVVIGVLIALGTTLMVRALGLNKGETSDTVGAGSANPNQPLPTKALPVPGESQSPGGLVTPSGAPTDGATGPIQLSISPVMARPMERVNLTGSYSGHDNVGLQVQREESGQWADFGVQATVRAGTFETYVMTGRPGENRFRMYDPQDDQASNVVVVTID
ncbi:MAG: hypothetical protein ABIN79_00355 [Marmoricola sp.]